MAAKRKLSAMAAASLDDEPVDPSDELMFLCLGGGNEVGRSCHIIQYKGKTIMLDAGMHPGYDGLAALPFFDEFDLSTVDILLISHCHIDHAASLPYVLSKTNFRGRVIMTHPTKAIYKWLIQDSVRVGNTSTSSEQRTQIYTEEDHTSTFSKIETIDYYSTHTMSSVRITPYPAGHILGAAMFLIEIAGLNVLFTGDYSREHDRHLIPAEVPKNVKVDVLITESTYGVASHVPRLEREAALLKSVTGILNRGGRALLPILALGRVQELLLIFDEYWTKHPEYRKFPVYYASNLARKCMQIYQSYIGAMNENIKKMFRERAADLSASGITDANKGGPWDFKYIRSLRSLDRFDDIGGCVMLASPGMLQSGVSRELLEKWAPDARNGVVITGYSVEGTMGKLIISEPDTIPAIMTTNAPGATLGKNKGKDGDHPMIPRRCSVDEFSFAAHVDGRENQDFIEQIAAPVVILVHGEKHAMARLRSKLLSLNNNKPANQKTKVFSPPNCKEVRIPIRKDKPVKVVGKLADRIVLPERLSSSGKVKRDPNDNRQYSNGAIISGVLVQNDFNLTLIDPSDLREYAGLDTTVITCRQRLTMGGVGVELIRWALQCTFGDIEDLTEHENKALNGNGDEENPKAQPGQGTDEQTAVQEHADEEIDRVVYKFRVMETVTITSRNQGEIIVKWEANMVNDSIADAVMSALLGAESTRSAVKQSSQSHSHSHDHDHDHDPSQSTNGALTNAPSDSMHASLANQIHVDRVMLFLEAHFGADNVSPMAKPRPSNNTPDPAIKPDPDAADAQDQEAPPPTITPAESTELSRLHALGLPVPGVLVKSNKVEAIVWLEDLSVECKDTSLRESVKSVISRAVGGMSSLWTLGEDELTEEKEGAGEGL